MLRIRYSPQCIQTRKRSLLKRGLDGLKKYGLPKSVSQTEPACSRKYHLDGGQRVLVVISSGWCYSTVAIITAMANNRMANSSISTMTKSYWGSSLWNIGVHCLLKWNKNNISLIKNGWIKMIIYPSACEKVDSNNMCSMKNRSLQIKWLGINSKYSLNSKCKTVIALSVIK